MVEVTAVWSFDNIDERLVPEMALRMRSNKMITMPPVNLIVDRMVLPKSVREVSLIR